MKRLLSLALAVTFLVGTAVLPACSLRETTATSTSAQTPLTTPSTAPDTTPDNTEGKVPQEADTMLYDLLTNDLINPIGLDDETPVFSWKTRSKERGWAQSAYQITVKSAEETVWDSGKVAKDSSVGIVYEGKALSSSTVYTWTLCVWDKTGENTLSAEATFETGLLGPEAFRDTNWISYDEQPLYTGTTYTIDFDFVIERDNQGFCFGMQDSGTFVMWQVNTFSERGNNRVLLRPHFKEGGTWTAYPGGPGNVQAIDITEAIGYTGTELIGKTVHERIEVVGRTVKTYFGADENHLTLASTYTHSSSLPLYRIGFRHSTNTTEDKEVAGYDNLVVKNADGEVIYQNDFSSASDAAFVGSSVMTVEDGRLKIGTTETAGEYIFVSSDGQSLPVFRKTFSVKEGLVSAKLYTSGLGVYESYVNGARVGRLLADGTVAYHELKPGFTEMADRKFYSTYDITWMLEEGRANALSAVVSPSWWSDGAAAHYGKDVAYLAKLILTYADGRCETLVSDTSWKSAKASAVIYADIFTGERYDARVDTSWMLPDYDDSAWANVKINREFNGELCAYLGSPVTVRADLEREPVSISVYKGALGATATAYGKVNTLATYHKESFVLNPGETALIDFGQNFAGWEAFTVEGEAGSCLSIEHGEILNDENGAHSRGNDGPEGSIYNANYRSAEAKTVYILSGKGRESYHPSFTFYGFRYIEITTDRSVTIHAVSGQVVTSVEKETGFLTTSDPSVNQLIHNIRWGQYSNYLSVPTDCPQRDERQGWTADTQVFAEAGCYLAFSKSFLEKFTVDLRDAQNAEGAYPGTAPTGAYNGGGWGGTGWADAGILLPYKLYMLYGDASVIRDNWDSMQRYVDGFLAKTDRKGPMNIWGDWLAYESNDATIQSMLAVAFYAWDALMMAEMAEAIGLDTEAARYRALYESEKAYFIEQYVNTNGTLKRQEQSVCLYALYLDLLPDEASVAAVTKQLENNIKRNKNRLQTGFLGTAILLPTLTKIGRSDLAYTLLLQHENPSWLYSVDQGATTVWERWNSYTIESGFGDVGMNSFNHYAYGAVAAWMFDSMAGIDYDPQTPGFKRIVLDPQPDSRLAFEASYESAYGTIKAKSSYEGAKWTYECTLPANTTAAIRLPVAKSEALTVNGKAPTSLTLEEDGIVFVGTENGVAVFEAVSASFVFVRTPLS